MLSEAHMSTKQQIIVTCDVLYMRNKRKLDAHTECTCMAAIIQLKYIHMLSHVYGRCVT